MPLEHKRLLCILAFLLVFFSYSFAQFTYTSTKSRYFSAFLESTTYVALTGEEEVDDKIRQLIKERWKFNEVKFFQRKPKPQESDDPYPDLDPDAEELPKSVRPGDSFIDLAETTIDGDYGHFYHKSLNLQIPENVNFSRMTNIIASVPIDCGEYNRHKLGQECEADQIVYKYDILINQLIETIEFTQLTKYRPTLAHVSGIHKYAKSYNKYGKKNFRLKKAKPLLVNKEIFSKSCTAADFEKIYGFPHKIVEKDEYESILSSGSKEYLVLLKAQSPKAILSVYDLEEKKTVFIDVNYTSVGVYAKQIRVNKGQLGRLNQHMSAILP